MSWFNRRPKIKNTNKTTPSKTSWMGEKLLKETKEKVYLGGSKVTGIKTEPD
jgi:hypothetical protein